MGCNSLTNQSCEGSLAAALRSFRSCHPATSSAQWRDACEHA